MALRWLILLCISEASGTAVVVHTVCLLGLLRVLLREALCVSLAAAVLHEHLGCILLLLGLALAWREGVLEALPDCELLLARGCRCRCRRRSAGRGAELQSAYS